VKINLKMKCSHCGYWNRVAVAKVFIQPPSPIDPDNVKVLIPMYEPLEVTKCDKCGKVLAEPKELIKVVRRPKQKSDILL